MRRQIIDRAISDIGYVLNLKGKLKEIVSHAYILSLEYTHGNYERLYPLFVSNDLTDSKTQVFLCCAYVWRSLRRYSSDSVLCEYPLAWKKDHCGLSTEKEDLFREPSIVFWLSCHNKRVRG